MKKFGLIGYPVSHSKSPLLFMAAYKNSILKDNLSYDLINEPDFNKALDIFLKGDYTGINITAPFKELIFNPQTIQYLNINYNFIPDKTSQFLKSANILIKEEQRVGKPILRSYNSDYLGVKAILENLQRDNIKLNHVAVFGAGGAGKSASLAVSDLGIKLSVINRSDQTEFCNRLNNYAGKTCATYYSIYDTATIESIIENTDMIIYTLPMATVDIKNIISNHKQILLEANYASPSFDKHDYEIVKSIDTNRDCTIKYISGKEWLLQQAIPAFSLFTGLKPEISEMKKIVNN